MLLAHELAHVVQHSDGRNDPLKVRRQEAGAGPMPLEDRAARPASKAIIRALQEVPQGVSAGTGDFPKVFRILNGLAMFDILDTLSEFENLGEFELIQDNVGLARGVGISRIQVAMAAVSAHGNVTADDFAAAQGDAFSSLESVQQTDIRNFLAKSGPTPAPTQDRPPPAAPADSTATMTTGEKLVRAYEYANIGVALRAALNQRFGPQQLVVMIGAGIAVFMVAQVTPVGWIADVGLALTAAFVAKSLFDAFHHFAAFAAAADATTDFQLHQAGDEFAKAVAGLEIDTIMLVLTMLSGGASGAAGSAGRAASAAAPSGQAVLLGAGGVRLGTIVAADAASTATVISAAQAAQLGLKGAALANAMMSQGGGSTGSPGAGAAGGGASPKMTTDTFVRGGVRFRLRGRAGDFASLEAAEPGNQVYVFRDAQGNVTYVGITERSGLTRMGEHLARDKPGEFLGDAATIEIKGVGLNEKDALALEEDLISEHNPKWNDIKNPYGRKFQGSSPAPEDVRRANNVSRVIEILFGDAP